VTPKPPVMWDVARRAGCRRRPLVTNRTRTIGLVTLGTAHFGPMSILVALNGPPRGRLDQPLGPLPGQDSSRLGCGHSEPKQKRVCQFQLSWTKDVPFESDT
jgi:hypothetical protein